LALRRTTDAQCFVTVPGRVGRVAASVRMIANETGFSKSAIPALQKRKLISTKRVHATAVPEHMVARPWHCGR
jgi:hypothetical protein